MKKSALILALCLGIALPLTAAELKPTFANPYAVLFDTSTGTYRPITAEELKAGVKSYGRLLAEEALAEATTEAEQAAAAFQIEEANVEEQVIEDGLQTAEQYQEVVEDIARQDSLLKESQSGTLVTP